LIIVSQVRQNMEFPPMSRPKAIFNQINIVTGDLSASVAFYRRLGVDIPEETFWKSRTGVHHASAKKTEGGTESNFDVDTLASAQVWNSGWRGRGDLKGKVVVGFRLSSRDAVDETYADLTGAGYPGLQAPHDAFWGARYAIVEDPDGVAVGLMSPVSDDKRSPPPEV
jgi:catechol 2,3-dioxygenase-like lactoylglutathione lyase family enzyme